LSELKSGLNFMKKKQIGIILIITIPALLVIISLVGNQGFIPLYKNHSHMKQLSIQIKKSQATIDSLQNEIKRLKNDTSYIEKIAREKLGMAKKNEKVYKFVEENSSEKQ
jgi:cell division protein FtsL